MATITFTEVAARDDQHLEATIVDMLDEQGYPPFQVHSLDWETPYQEDDETGGYWVYPTVTADVRLSDEREGEVAERGYPIMFGYLRGHIEGALLTARVGSDVADMLRRLDWLGRALHEANRRKVTL